MLSARTEGTARVRLAGVSCCKSHDRRARHGCPRHPPTPTPAIHQMAEPHLDVATLLLQHGGEADELLANLGEALVSEAQAAFEQQGGPAWHCRLDRLWALR